MDVRYLCPAPKGAGQYIGTRQRGKPLAAPTLSRAEQLWARGDVGWMTTPRAHCSRGVFAQAPFWAADTGCYAQGERFDLGRYLAWLDGARPHQATCLFATAPDVVGDWAATWARSRDVLPQLRALGYRAAIVLQDGCTTLPDPALWDVVFVGGTTAYKLSETTYALVREAKALGRWCHMGRVNSWIRLKAAALSGYDSADGTCLTRNPPQYVQEISGWLDRLRQPRLSLFAPEPALEGMP